MAAALPQPGDGAWLVNSSKYRSQRPQRSKSKPRSFLPHVEDDAAATRLTSTSTLTSLHNIGSSNSPSFLPHLQEHSVPTSSHNMMRTMAVPQISTSADDSTALLAAPNLRHLPAPVKLLSESKVKNTTEKLNDFGSKQTNKKRSRSAKQKMATGDKAVPPHLRAKIATAQPKPSLPRDAKASQQDIDIREKLAIEFGITVRHPKPAHEAHPASGDANDKNVGPVDANVSTGPQRGSKQHEETSTPSKDAETPTKSTGKGKKRKSKPTGHSKAAREANDDFVPFHGRPGNESKLDGRDAKPRDKAFPRQSTWARKTDVPKGEPSPKAFAGAPGKTFGSSSNIDSAEADGGWGDGKKRRAPANAQGFELSDWNDQWAPAPLDWDARPAFRDDKKLMQIECWIAEATDALQKEQYHLAAHEITKCVEDIVPSYWIPHGFPGSSSLQAFWEEVSNSKHPEPVEESDLDGVHPWWECLQPYHNMMLLRHEHPEISSVDPDETIDERLARENDFGSAQHSENRRRLERAKRDAKREKRKKADEKTLAMNRNRSTLPHEKITPDPDLKLFVRPARPADMTAIRDIYNHYIDNTCCAPETERITENDMLQRFQRITKGGLPFLVACKSGGIIRGVRWKRDPENELFLSDVVLGFTYAEDHGQGQPMYRSTVDLHVFVDKQFLLQSIAKCLLDKMVGILDPAYIERGGFGSRCEGLEATDSLRTVKNIIARVPFDAPQRLEWVAKWLIDWLGFEQKGVLEGIGVKNGRLVSEAIFQRNNGVKTGIGQSTLSPW
ncbi:hypothetical protein BTJ68_10218 [Hortaea werneckii EXF-2000]|uniref:N-acetyltransferase domain-containing protein n=2 Tax=Hortaea werneckii TaxID=91943 RepID=A0A3M7IRA7_HORWE|nr:hypothetical protein BTJ68_10218 [Hortaea werneckii EXF-2000]RMZ28101.1 hypothetical protein D0859_07824 [Hortaea werneckii]